MVKNVFYSAVGKKITTRKKTTDRCEKMPETVFRIYNNVVLYDGVANSYRYVSLYLYLYTSHFGKFSYNIRNTH